MLCLLPRWDVWWWWNVHARHRVRVRRHIGLHSLARERWRYVCWLLFIRAEHRSGRLLPCGRRWTREGPELISAIDGSRPALLRRLHWWEVRAGRCLRLRSRSSSVVRRLLIVLSRKASLLCVSSLLSLRWSLVPLRRLLDAISRLLSPTLRVLLRLRLLLYRSNEAGWFWWRRWRIVLLLGRVCGRWLIRRLT